MYKLRPHQKDALKTIVKEIKQGKGSARGRVVVPTGGGKTFIEAALLKHQMKKNAETNIHLVLSPRILLTNQLIDEYRKFIGPDAYRVIAFHSGNYSGEEPTTWKETNTTNPKVIHKHHADAKKLGQHLVVFSTYHSAHKLADIKFDTLIADESQYCVFENFNDTIKMLNARVQGFFTATERHTASQHGRGLNNEALFGSRWYYISPADLIKHGLIVPPRLHIMYAETRSEKNTVVDEVKEIAKEQHRLTNPELGFSKILYAMNGTADVKTIEENIHKLRKELPQHDVFTITSKTGAKINGKYIRRELFLNKLKDSTNSLIFHYDILSEGIDVDGITGVALMRNLGLAKLLQTIGRAVRVYQPDPKSKRQAWISVSVLNGDEDDKERVKSYVNIIRNGGYDISAEHIIETGAARHTADSQDLDDAYVKLKPNWADLFLIKVMHEIEDDNFWSPVKKANNNDAKLDIFFHNINQI